ncbi:unnamed protein product [Meloidogyne enterolobii]|uniref:Uncharacterized protein n=1 Tax=Meloidogyne enterolobii TaxID=390850 RepID=A0ACB0ZJF5_MELEN
MFGISKFPNVLGIKQKKNYQFSLKLKKVMAKNKRALNLPHPVCSTRSTPREKIREALGALGWPLTQGAISTILAVVVLADVPAYMIVTFFKTVFLAITLGLLHGLVFLPVALVLFVRGCCTGNTHVIQVN